MLDATQPIQIKSIIIRPIGDAVGDAVAHIGHIRQLKQSLPNIRIGCFVTSRNRDVFQASGLVDELIDDTVESILRHHKKWDLQLNFIEKYHQMNCIADLALGVPTLVIPKYYDEILNQFDGDFTIAKPSPQHHIRDYLSYSPIGQWLTHSAYFYLPPNPETKAFAEQFWHPYKIRVLISPIGTYRFIRPNELANLLNNLPASLTKDCDFVVGHHRVAENYTENVANFSSVPLRIGKETTLKEYLMAVESADIVISVDSGTVHLACAYARPLLAFYANYKPNLAMWMPSPRDHTPTIMTLGQAVAENSNATEQFDIPSVVPWLKEQITKVREKMMDRFFI